MLGVAGETQRLAVADYPFSRQLDQVLIEELHPVLARGQHLGQLAETALNDELLDDRVVAHDLHDGHATFLIGALRQAK